MAYAERGDIDNIFGKDSVDQWADLNNKRIPKEIKARLDWALALAESKVNAALRGGPYVIPFTGTIDPIIVDLTARWAGVLLYDGRRIVDTEDEDSTIDLHRDMCNKTTKMLIGGSLRLDITHTSYTFPQVIT
jgi:phage gp36-like protein